MEDLFGEIAAGNTQAKLKRVATKTPRVAPVVTGGLFPLNDEINPARFSAVFSSGASAFYDAAALTSLSIDIGVVAGLVRPSITSILRDYLCRGGKVFVDSGAFGQYEEYAAGKADSPVVDFDRVFATYRDIMEGVPADCLANLSIVMPDVLCDLPMSLDLLRQYRADVVGFIDSGANVIVPIQKGETRAGRTTEIVKDILGTQHFTLGIPSATAAMELADVATIRNHRRFHVLGRGAMGMPLFQRVYAFLEHNPGADVSCDANQIRSHLPIITPVHQQLVSDRECDIWNVSFDNTEIFFDMLHTRHSLTKAQIVAIARFYSIMFPIDSNAWVAAYLDGDTLAEILSDIDPEGAMLADTGLRDVFHGSACKFTSARLRKLAVMNAFKTEELRRQLPPPSNTIARLCA